MRIFLQVAAAILGAIGMIQLLNAVLGNGPGLLATLTLLGAVAAMTAAVVIERLDRLIAKP